MNPLLHFNFYPARQPDAPALLILHGLLGSCDNWHTQAKKLAVERDVFAIDLRNHGDSPHIKGMGYREMVADLIALTQHLGLKQFDLVGHSMGGKVAMQLALNQPVLIHRLVVVDIAPKTYPLWHQSLLQGLLNCPLEQMQNRSDVDAYLSDWIADPLERGFILKNLTRASHDGDNKQLFSWKFNIEEITRNYLKLAGFPETGQPFNGKTCFIRGEQSPYIQQADQDNIKRHFTNYQLVTLPGSGHLPHIEQAAAFYHTVNAFLEQPN